MSLVKLGKFRGAGIVTGTGGNVAPGSREGRAPVRFQEVPTAQ